MAKPTTQVNTWKEELAKEASAAQAALPAASGDWLSVRQGRMKFKGADVPGNKAEFIILDFIRENQFYEGRFDPDNAATPCCYAFGNDEKTMAPHEKSTKPQHTDCATCPNNQWGTSETGKGRACKNVLRLALIAATDDPKAIADEEVVWMKVSVTSVKNFSAYANQLASALSIPPFAAITEIASAPDAKTQQVVTFKLAEEIQDGAVIKAIMDKRKTFKIDFPYQERTSAPAHQPAQRSRFGGARKL